LVIPKPRYLGAIRHELLRSLRGGMARHSIGNLAARLFGLGCGFLYAVLVARMLGPAGYGVVVVAMSMATLVATVSLLGANELSVRAIAAFSARKAWEDLRCFVIWSLRTVTGASLAAALAMAAMSLLRGPYSSALLIGSFAVPLFALLYLLRGLILGSGRVVAAQLPLNVAYWVVTLALIGALAGAQWKVTPSTIVVVALMGLGLSLAVAGAILGKYLGGLPRVTSSSSAQQPWLWESIPFLAIALFGIIGTEIGTLLLGWLAGPREAGLYQPIAKLAPLMLLANEAIEAALAPKIVHSWEQNDHQSLQRRVSRSALVSALATAVIVAIIIIASPYILRAFGPEFIKYQSLLVWIGIAQLVNAATGAAPLLLAMTGDMRNRISAQAATMVVQVGLSVALIPVLGAGGAVAALVAAILLWSLLHWWLALRATGIDTSMFGVLSVRRRAV
jgi:O-antigen/teichoic acid export membrane protein